MLSLVKTLARWYSAVRVLRNRLRTRGQLYQDQRPAPATPTACSRWTPRRSSVGMIH